MHLARATRILFLRLHLYGTKPSMLLGKVFEVSAIGVKRKGRGLDLQ